METLQMGSRAIPVKLLQRLLNKKAAASLVAEDGVFGPQTQEAVRAFQGRERIAQDGVVGANTWSRLGITSDITHPVRLFGQPTGMTCSPNVGNVYGRFYRGTVDGFDFISLYVLQPL